MRVSFRGMTMAACILATSAGVMAAASLQAAPISWTLTNFNESALDLSGTIHQAVNFSNTSQNVTINGITVEFVSSEMIMPDNGGFPNGPNETAAGDAMYTNVVGNTELINMLRSHSWRNVASQMGQPNQVVPLSGLTAGTPYQIQAFMHDGRSGPGPGTQAYGDDIDPAATPDTDFITRNSGTIAIGDFVADSTTQDFVVFRGTADPGLSGYVVRIAGPPPVLGDTDGDGVGGEFPDDFEPIRANFRKMVDAREMGDLVRNGRVDFDDFRQWKAAHLGGGGSLEGLDLGFTTNVPEPSTGALALVAMLGIGVRGRRRSGFPA